MKILLSYFFTLWLLPQFAIADAISIAGSTTVNPLMQLLTKKYQASHASIYFYIDAEGSKQGFGAAISQHAHIGMMSRELSETEMNKMDGYKSLVIAYDTTSPIISDEIYHLGNITKISIENLAKIYRGEINNWRELGGPNRPILVVDAKMHHGSRYVFAKALLGSPTAKVTKRAVVIDGDVEMANLVKASDQAISYISAAFGNEDIHTLSILVNGKVIEPSRQNIQSGTYPFSRKLHLIVPNHLPAYVQAFIDFVLSPEGQAIVKQAGYVPVLHGS